MTILYLTNSDVGGANYSLLNLIRSLGDNIEPIVVMPRCRDAFQMFVDKGIEIHAIPFREEIFNLATFGRMSALRKLLYVMGRVRDTLRWNVWMCWRIKRVLAGRHIDIVHTNTGAITQGGELARALGAKHVWHLRELQDGSMNCRPFWGWKRFRRMLNNSDAVIGITKIVCEHFNVTSRRANGYCLWDAVASESEAINNPHKQPYVLFAAAFISPMKGLNDLVAAYAASSLPSQGIRLRVVGRFADDRCHLREVNQMCMRCNVENMVDFIGPTCQIREMMAEAQMFVMPSIDEALGRVAVEAMFYGCPVITRRSGGPTDFMRHGENGFMFSTQAELTQLLDKVAKEDLTAMVQRAQQFAIDHFSEETYGRRLMMIYKTVCNTDNGYE